MKNDKTTLTEALKAYSQKGVCPMHMPGHKRQPLPIGQLPLQLDITEISGFDNLHQPEGILKESMQRAAKLYGAERSFYLVNGSTGGILAGIAAATKPGDTIIMVRGCHKSVYHGLEIRQLNPVYLQPAMDDVFSVAASISPQQVEQALKEHPHAKLVLITSPTYEGVISDIASIGEVCHKRGVPLMVDEAHGAHLGFSPWFSGGAVQAGADIVIQSLHKTLPSPTQTAIAHWQGGRISVEEFARQLSIFQTSSPSYLFMAAIDDCIHWIEEHSATAFAEYQKRMEEFSFKMEQLQRLRVLCYGKDKLDYHCNFFGFDRGKVVISTKGTNFTGNQLKDILREEYAIELEMAMGDYALAMTSVLDTSVMLEQLAEAILQIDRQAESAPMQTIQQLPLPKMALPPWKARLQSYKEIDILESVGKVSAESVWAYPPGVPLVTAGECIDVELLQQLQTLQNQGVELHSESDSLPYKIRVLQGEL